MLRARWFQPRKWKLAPSKKGLATSRLSFLYGSTRDISPPPSLIRRQNFSWGCCVEKWDSPKRGVLGFFCPCFLRRRLVTRPSVILLDFPCFIGISAVLGFWMQSSPFVLVHLQNGPVRTPKSLRFKGEMSNFDAKTTIKRGKKTAKGRMVPCSVVKSAKSGKKCCKTGKNAKRTKGSIFHACTGGALGFPHRRIYWGECT